MDLDRLADALLMFGMAWGMLNLLLWLALKIREALLLLGGRVDPWLAVTLAAFLCTCAGLVLKAVEM